MLTCSRYKLHLDGITTNFSINTINTWKSLRVLTTKTRALHRLCTYLLYFVQYNWKETYTDLVRTIQNVNLILQLNTDA